MTYLWMDTPLGALRVEAGEAAITGAWFEDGKHAPAPSGEEGDTPLLREAVHQLRAYFDRRLTVFDLPLDARGTEFQRRVWAALRDIPYGERRSYADIARAVGSPQAVRAVGAANGRNPHTLLVPCHRVVGSDGSLTGYGGGMHRKQWLLAHEGMRNPQVAFELRAR